MIAQITGTVTQVGLREAVISLDSGLGMQVYCPPRTLSALQVSQRATLFTSLVVREDSLTLYGFSSSDERDVFNIVLTVKGFGPRNALALLSSLELGKLRAAIANKDAKIIAGTPGVGIKTAQKFLLEIGTKLDYLVATADADENSGAATTFGVPVEENVEQALINLGWSADIAASAVGSVKETLLSGNPDLAQQPQYQGLLLRQALQLLGK